MDDLIAELKKRIEFKETIGVGDVVFIAAEDPQMLTFAVVTDVSRDFSRKDEWWHVSMQMLSVPLQPMTWTLRMVQMCGEEIFTMGGKKRFMAPVRIPYGPRQPEDVKKEGPGQQKPKKKSVLRVVK